MTIVEKSRLATIYQILVFKVKRTCVISVLCRSGILNVTLYWFAQHLCRIRNKSQVLI